MATVTLQAAYADVLRSTRLQQGLTLRQVSNKAHIALGYLSEIENKVKDPSTPTLEQLVTKGLGLSLQHFAYLVYARVSA